MLLRSVGGTRPTATHADLGKVPDAKTLARIGQAISGEVVAELHRRLVKLAQEKGAIEGRKMRVDTTVVETNIHYRMSSQGWRIQRESTPVRAKVRSPVAMDSQEEGN